MHLTAISLSARPFSCADEEIAKGLVGLELGSTEMDWIRKCESAEWYVIKGFYHANTNLARIILSKKRMNIHAYRVLPCTHQSLLKEKPSEHVVV